MPRCNEKPNPKQKLFIAEYLIDLNASQAAIRAGYSKKNANVVSAQLMADPDVKREIDRRVAARMENLDLGADSILNEVARLSYANMLDYITVQDGDAFVDLSKLTRAQAAAISEITVEEYTEGRGEGKRQVKKTRFKLADKKGPLELLGKYRKLWTDKIDHSGAINLGELTDKQLEELAQRLEQSAPKS